MQRLSRIAALVTMCALLISVNGTSAQNLPPPFQTTWERPDQPVAAGQVSRTWMWGPQPFTGVLNESYTESPGGQRQVVYYDKSRMEITNPAGDQSSIWYVTNGLLATELITGQMQMGHSDYETRSPANVNVAGDSNDATGPTYATFTGLIDQPAAALGDVITSRVARDSTISTDQHLQTHQVQVATIDEVTNHAIAAPFWEFMTASGLVYEAGSYTTAKLFENPFFATGRPITEAYWANVKVADTYMDVLLQCFERRCLTYTPGNPEGWQVEAGNVGQHYCTWRYGAECHTGTPPQGVPDPAPSPDPAPQPSPDPTPTTPTTNCSAFATQEEAQEYFESRGGSPSNNVDGLDENGNGIACEHLPSSTPPPPPPPPPPAHPSEATALCRDGTYSYSKTASGTCAGHGGVEVWINRP